MVSLEDHRNNRPTLLNFWDRLQKVTRLTFYAHSQLKEEKGWNGQGKGEVMIAKEQAHCLLFNEKGTWLGWQSGELSFRNTFRWSLDHNRGMISLEHLRQGPAHPVFLFYLAPTGTSALSSVDPHLCAKDGYVGEIDFNQHRLHLKWSIIGPKKNEEIHYFYY